MGKKTVIFLAVCGLWQQVYCVIIILNGTGSSGKTSIACELKQVLPFAYEKVTLDELVWQQLIATAQKLQLLPENISISDAKKKLESFDRAVMDQLWLQAQIDPCLLYKKVHEFVQQGKHVLVDTVMRYEDEIRSCLYELHDLEVCMILIYCPLAQLPLRVQERNSMGILGENRLLRWAVQEFLSMYCPCSNGQPCIDFINKKQIIDVLEQVYNEFYAIARDEKGFVSPEVIKQADAWLADVKKTVATKFTFDKFEQIGIYPQLRYDCVINTGIYKPAICAQQIKKCIAKRGAFHENGLWAQNSFFQVN